jgi:hypothetical protein
MNQNDKENRFLVGLLAGLAIWIIAVLVAFITILVWF